VTAGAVPSTSYGAGGAGAGGNIFITSAGSAGKSGYLKITYIG
jgi:hypothetical protein